MDRWYCCKFGKNLSKEIDGAMSWSSIDVPLCDAPVLVLGSVRAKVLTARMLVVGLVPILSFVGWLLFVCGVSISGRIVLLVVTVIIVDIHR